MGELWQRLERLFHDCAGIPPALRSEYLDVRCAGEPHVRSEVEALLAAITDSEGWVEEIIRRAVDEPVPGCGCDRSAHCGLGFPRNLEFRIPPDKLKWEGRPSLPSMARAISMKPDSGEPKHLPPGLTAAVGVVEKVLGDVVARVEGEALFEVVEGVRREMVAFREAKDEVTREVALDRAAAALAELLRFRRYVWRR